jgi:hypothetical protein
VKIKEAETSEKQEPLEKLVLKWRTAGREVAREVWDLVKDSAKTNDGAWGSDQGGLGSGWGWDEGEGQDDEVSVRKRAKREEEEEEESESTSKVEDNIGTMLRQLRIDPATLGWDDEEGDFVD